MGRRGPQEIQRNIRPFTRETQRFLERGNSQKAPSELQRETGESDEFLGEKWRISERECSPRFD